MSLATDHNPKQTYYVVSTDGRDLGDAFRDEDVARRLFERLAASGQFVRLLIVEGSRASELDRRNQ